MHGSRAGILGALAVCTRVNGIMALPAFAWLVWSAGRRRPAPVVRWASVGLVVAGFAAWCAYVYALSGSLIEWKHSIERWGYFPGASTWGPLPDLVQALVTRPYEYLTSEAAAPYDTLNGVTAILFVLSIPFVWWKLGTAYGLFMLANLALPLSSGQFEGLGRYCSVLFPFFIWYDYVLRFVPSLAKIFPQDIVVSEQLHRDTRFEYVAPHASRTTTRPCRRDFPV